MESEGQHSMSVSVTAANLCPALSVQNRPNPVSFDAPLSEVSSPLFYQSV